MAATLKTTVIQEPSSSTVNLTLSSSGGVTFGAAATTNTITSAAATALTIQSAGTTAMTIDTSQNVGIGTTSPNAKFNVSTASATNGIGIRIDNSGSTGAGIQMFNGYDDFEITMPTTTGGMRFIASGTNERMRIDSSGNLLVGTTSTFGKLSTLVSNGGVAWGSTNTSGTGLYYAAIFYNNGTSLSGCGSIVVSGTSTAYNVTSDYRLKENVTPMTTGLATIAALKPVTYDWISDKSEGEGFIAHELQAVIPAAVTGEKDAVNGDGSIKPQGVDYSKIVVHLVAALQELSAKVDAQAVEITALKAKVGA
jgi:hypothetical protein